MPSLFQIAFHFSHKYLISLLLRATILPKRYKYCQRHSGRPISLIFFISIIYLFQKRESMWSVGFQYEVSQKSCWLWEEAAIVLLWLAIAAVVVDKARGWVVANGKHSTYSTVQLASRTTMPCSLPICSGLRLTFTSFRASCWRKNTAYNFFFLFFSAVQHARRRRLMEVQSKEVYSRPARRDEASHWCCCCCHHHCLQSLKQS